MSQPIQNIVMPDTPPENAYQLLSEIEMEIRGSRSLEEKIHAHLHWITVAAAWLSGDEEYSKQKLLSLKPNMKQVKEKYWKLWGKPLVSTMESHHQPAIRMMGLMEYLDNLYYEKLQITIKLRERYSWKFGTEPPKLAYG